jgi:predicted metalloprotease with PDZ domain
VSGPGEKIERFTQHVKRRTPGSKVPIGVLRPARISRTIKLAAAEEPGKTFDGATFVSLPAIMVGISPASGIQAHGGLMATSVVPGSPVDRAGLKSREIVTTINGTPVPHQADARMLTDAVRQLKPGDPITIEVTSIHELNMTVTIGRRPVSRLNPDDLREAREQFAVWWGEQTSEDSIERSDKAASFQPPAILQPPEPEPAVVP